MMKNTYLVKGMTCDACADTVTQRLSGVAGVQQVKVDLASSYAVIESGHPVPADLLQAALAGSIYEIAGTDAPQQAADQIDEQIARNRMLVTEYITAVGGLRHDLLEPLLHPNFTFDGGARYTSAKDYIAMIKAHAASPVAEILKGYDIKAVYADEEGGVVIYDSVSRFPGLNVAFTEQVSISDNRIKATQVRFNKEQMKRLVQEMANYRKQKA